MTDSQGIWEVPREYVLKVAKRRGTGHDEFHVHERFEIPVPSLPAREPVVSLLRDRRCAVEWREHDGETWRTFEVPDGKDVVDAEAYRRMLDRFCCPDPHKRPASGWQDLAFRDSWEQRGSVWLGRSIPVASVPPIRGRVVLEDGRAAAWAKAVDDARNVVLFDGVPHRRSPPPVWRIAPNASGTVWVGPVLVEDVAGSCMTFPHDRLDDALALANRIANQTGGAISRSDADALHHSIPGRPVARDMAAGRAFNSLKALLWTQRVADLPLECLALLGKGAEGMIALAAGRTEEGVASIETTIEAFAGLDVDRHGKAASVLSLGVKLSREYLVHARFAAELDEGDIVALEGLGAA